MTKPLVTLIVSNINGMNLDLLPHCLDSLMHQDYKNWELIVVDNGSTDNSISYLKKRFSKSKNCRFLKNPVNMYTQGINMAVDKANGEYIANFNNDLALKENYLSLLINEMQKDKNLGVIHGILLNFYDHNIIDSAGETMDLYGNPVTIGSKEKYTGKYKKSEEILSACGAACVFAKSTFKKLGSYDPEYGIGYEDMDFSLRARRVGYSIKRFPKAECYHKRAKTDLEDFVKLKVKWHFNKNRITTMIKNYPIKLLLKTIPVTIMLYLGIAFWEWFVNKNWKVGWTRISAIFWVITNLGEILKKRSLVSKLGSTDLKKSDLQLFSPKSIFSIFKDFSAAR